MTIEELMRLVYTLKSTVAIREAAQWSTLRSMRQADVSEAEQALRTAIEQLVTENASLKATLEREIDLCKRMMVERDQAVQEAADERKEFYGACACRMKDPQKSVELEIECFFHQQIRLGREQAVEQVGRLKKEIKEFWWWSNEDGEYGCRHCSRFTEHPEDWSDRDEPIDFPHAAGCIVRECEPG